MLKGLDEATAGFKTFNSDDVNDLAFADADLFYEGDIDKWKKFGYSIMLRLAMRISNVDATTADTYVAKAVAGGVFTSNDDNVWLGMAMDQANGQIKMASLGRLLLEMEVSQQRLVQRLSMS